VSAQTTALLPGKRVQVRSFDWKTILRRNASWSEVGSNKGLSGLQIRGVRTTKTGLLLACAPLSIHEAPLLGLPTVQFRAVHGGRETVECGSLAGWDVREMDGHPCADHDTLQLRPNVEQVSYLYI
jgi:hypothetical protein